jgi:hypothetical protein
MTEEGDGPGRTDADLPAETSEPTEPRRTGDDEAGSTRAQAPRPARVKAASKAKPAATDPATVAEPLVVVQQSGLEEADARSIDVHQGGIGRARARDISVTQGGIGMARGDRISVELGAVGLAAGSEVGVTQGAVNTVLARAVRVERAFVQTMIAGDVRAERQVGVLVLLARRVEGDIKPLLDWRGAVALGAAFAIVRSLFRRRG